jgi:hypothetical protein
MAASRKRDISLHAKPKHLEPATFKSSLRLWQARWKAQKALRGELTKDASVAGASASA